MSMPTDISFVAVSEGKSILFSEDTEGLVVPLRPTKNESNTTLLHALDKQTLDDMRTLVGAKFATLPHMDIFGIVRQNHRSVHGAKKTRRSTQAKMHSWLTMSRLQSLLKGRNEITVDSWEEIMELERTVKNRRAFCSKTRKTSRSLNRTEKFFFNRAIHAMFYKYKN